MFDMVQERRLEMSFLSGFLGLLGAGAAYTIASVKETCDEVDLQRRLAAQKPKEPPTMRPELKRKFEAEWYRGDYTHFPEELMPAFMDDGEVLGWWINLLAEKEIIGKGYRGFPISIEGNFYRAYKTWKERTGWHE